jgi:hypothetical protein
MFSENGQVEYRESLPVWESRTLVFSEHRAVSPAHKVRDPGPVQTHIPRDGGMQDQEVRALLFPFRAIASTAASRSLKSGESRHTVTDRASGA